MRNPNPNPRIRVRVSDGVVFGGEGGAYSTHMPFAFRPFFTNFGHFSGHFQALPSGRPSGGQGEAPPGVLGYPLGGGGSKALRRQAGTRGRAGRQAGGEGCPAAGKKALNQRPLVGGTCTGRIWNGPLGCHSPCICDPNPWQICVSLSVSMTE
jgi:hypothetical protein